jgi:hypothetical protein
MLDQVILYVDGNTVLLHRDGKWTTGTSLPT